MHIILGALGLIVTILVLVNRLSEAGIDIGWLDPFKWQRRRKWKKEYNTDPLFSIEDPKTATAGLMYAMVKCSGDISREEKSHLLSVFRSDFKLSDREATDLLSVCSFHIKNENRVKDNLERYLKPSLTHFAPGLRHAAIELIEQTASCDGDPNEKQQEFLAHIIQILEPKKPMQDWQ